MRERNEKQEGEERKSQRVQYPLTNAINKWPIGIKLQSFSSTECTTTVYYSCQIPVQTLQIACLVDELLMTFIFTSVEGLMF